MKLVLRIAFKTLATAICLLPATLSAGLVAQFTLSSGTPYSSNGSGVSGSGSTEVVTIDYTDLFTDIDNVFADYSGFFTETYTNSTGILSVTGTNGISLTIAEATNLAPTFTGQAVSLYSGVTSVTFNSAFQTELGLSSNPSLVQISNTQFGVTANGAQVTSAIATMTITTPEPSTFAMFAIALLCGASFKTIGFNALWRRRTGAKQVSTGKP